MQILKLKKYLLVATLCIFAFSISIALYNSWQKNKLDGFEDWILSLLSFEDTIYAKNYSESNFSKIKIGVNRQQVIKMIGQPLYKGYKYKELCECDLAMVWIENDVVIDFALMPEKRAKKVKKGMSKKELIKNIGYPIQEFWYYSKTPSSKSYRIRIIKFESETAIEITHEFYMD